MRLVARKDLVKTNEDEVNAHSYITSSHFVTIDWCERENEASLSKLHDDSIVTLLNLTVPTPAFSELVVLTVVSSL